MTPPLLRSIVGAILFDLFWPVFASFTSFSSFSSFSSFNSCNSFSCFDSVDSVGSFDSSSVCCSRLDCVSCRSDPAHYLVFPNRGNYRLIVFVCLSRLSLLFWLIVLRVVFYFYLFYLLFDLSIVCSFVYRRFLSLLDLRLLDLCIFVPFFAFWYVSQFVLRFVLWSFSRWSVFLTSSMLIGLFSWQVGSIGLAMVTTSWSCRLSSVSFVRSSLGTVVAVGTLWQFVLLILVNGLKLMGLA